MNCVLKGNISVRSVCQNSSPTVALLTVLHLCDDRVGVQGFADTKLVDSRDSELVLITLDEVSGIERTSFTLGSDHGPGDSGCLPLFNHVMGNGSTAVVLWGVPPHGALLCCDAGKTNGPINRSRRICRHEES